MASHYQKRKAADRRFRYYGMAAVGVALLLLALLLGSIAARGWGGLQEAKLYLSIPTQALQPMHLMRCWIIRISNLSLRRSLISMRIRVSQILKVPWTVPGRY